VVYASRRQADAAFEWLERARRERDFDLLWVKSDPALDTLHADARFAVLPHEAAVTAVAAPAASTKPPSAASRRLERT
jgi:hypothetical protein